MFLMACRREIPHFTHRKFNIGIYNELPTQSGHTIGDQEHQHLVAAVVPPFFVMGLACSLARPPRVICTNVLAVEDSNTLNTVSLISFMSVHTPNISMEQRTC